jgi:integrase
MAGHTTMPPRIQKTPFGDVTLTSRWKRDRYYLMAYGAPAAIRWLFPKVQKFEIVGMKFRHTFDPFTSPVTAMRGLLSACQGWQARWLGWLQDHEEGVTTVSARSGLNIETLGQLFDHLQGQRKSTESVTIATWDRDRYRLNLWRTEIGNDRLLSEITPEMISDALARIGKRTSPSTANTSLGVIKTFLTWAANKGIILNQSHRTVHRLKVPSAQRHHRAWWTTEQVRLALQCAAQDPHQPTATLLVACGCMLGLRLEEIIMLRWQDLNLDATDPRTGVPNPVCHVTGHSGWVPKDKDARDIPISAELLTILQPHRQKEGFLLTSEPHRTGRPRPGTGWKYRYNPHKVWKRIMASVVKAGGTPITMYGMRHSFASNLLALGVSDVKVGRWMGHSDTRMVHRHYGHLLSYDADINVMRFDSLKGDA